MEEFYMFTLHNMSTSHTNGSVRSLLKMHFVDIKHIKIRWYLDQYFIFIKIKLSGFNVKLSMSILRLEHSDALENALLIGGYTLRDVDYSVDDIVSACAFVRHKQ